MSEKTIKKKSTYTIEVRINTDGTFHLFRKNDGFNPLELLGLLEMAQLEIIKQMSGEIQPDVIKREVIEP